MARLPILLYPNPFLRTVSIDASSEPFFVSLAKDLVDTLEHYRGLGISAVQVGYANRLFVTRTFAGGWLTHINPEIESVDGELTEMEEGCLSLPGVVERVKRYPNVILSSMDITGERRRYDLEGIEAQCAQHEMDHLDGKMFSDGAGPVKRDIYRRKIKKQLRLNPIHQETR